MRVITGAIILFLLHVCSCFFPPMHWANRRGLVIKNQVDSMRRPKKSGGKVSCFNALSVRAAFESLACIG